MLYQAYILLDQILLSHLNCAIIGADIQDYEPLSLAILCGPYVITALKFNIASKWHLYVTKGGIYAGPISGVGGKLSGIEN
jgi:hypothetical protein